VPARDQTRRSIGAYLAWNDDRLGLAWSDDSGGNYEVFFQTFDASGQPLTDGQRLAETSAHSMIPAIRPWRDGFALAWDEVVTGMHVFHDSPTHDPSTQAEVLFSFVR
jgi:hypothetical protein